MSAVFVCCRLPIVCVSQKKCASCNLHAPYLTLAQFGYVQFTWREMGDELAWVDRSCAGACATCVLQLWRTDSGAEQIRSYLDKFH